MPKSKNAEKVSSNITCSSQEGDDHDEEFGSEIIPRSVPTPIQKNKLTPMKFHSSIVQDNAEREEKIGSSVEDIRNLSLAKNTAIYHEEEKRRESYKCHSLERFQESQKSNIKVNDSMVGKLLFKSSNSPKVSEQSFKSSSTISLVERTSRLLQKLSTLGLIDQSQTEDRCDEDNILISKQPWESFLSLVYSMLEEISEQNQHHNHPTHVTMPIPSERELHFDGLINIIEVLLEKYSNLCQEKKFIEKICNDLRNQNVFRENIYYAQENQLELDATAQYAHQRECIKDSSSSDQTIMLLQQENEVLRRQLMEVDNSELMKLQNLLTGKHIECQKFQQIMQSFEEEHTYLHRKCEEKDAINLHIENDLFGLRKSNESILKANESLRAEVFRLTYCISNYEERLREADENVHSRTIAISEVTEKWNDALKERTRLESQIGQLTRELSVTKQKIHFSHDEINHLKQLVKKIENESQERLLEVSTSNQEKNKVGSEFQALKQSFDHLKKENHRLGSDLLSSKVKADLHSQKLHDLEGVVAKTKHDAGTYRSIASELEMERNTLKALLEQERTTIQKLESNLSTARTRDAAAAEQIRKIVKEKALLVTKLNEANARNNKHGSLFMASGSSSIELTSPPMKKVQNMTSTVPGSIVEGENIDTSSISKNNVEHSGNQGVAYVVTSSEMQPTQLCQFNEEADITRRDSTETEPLKRGNVALSTEPTSLLEYLAGTDV